MKYLVFQVGCLECSASSYPIKFCETLEEARKVASDHPSPWDSEGRHGVIVIYDLETFGEVK